MSSIKQKVHEEMENPNFQDLTMWDVTVMFVDHVVTRAKQVEFFNGSEFVTNTEFSLLECKVSVFFSLGASKLEILQEGENFVVVKDIMERREQYQVLKFIM